MEKLQSDLSELRKLGEDTSASIKLLHENLARVDQILDEMERRRAGRTPSVTTPAAPPTTPSARILTLMSEPVFEADESAAAATSIEETWSGSAEDHGLAAARVTSVPASPPAATTEASPTSHSVPAGSAAASHAAGDLPLVSPTRCSTKCAEEKANQEVTVLGLGATHMTTALLDQVRSVPWLSNSGYLADLQLKPPWPSWIGSGERLQLPLVTEEGIAVGCMPQEDLLGDRVDMHQLATVLFKPNSIGKQTKLQDILVQISTNNFAMQLINYHVDQDTRTGMAMSSVSRELYLINLDDAASFAVQMSNSEVEKLKHLSRELHYLWQFNIDAHVSFFPWNPGGGLLGYSSRELNFPCSYVVEESCYDILGIEQIHEMELNGCGFGVDILLPLVLMFAPDGIISFQDISDYSHNKWLFDRKSDIFGLLQLVTEALSHDTSKNTQADHAVTLTCSFGISCLTIAGRVDPEDMEPEAAAIYHVHTADVSVSEQGLAGYTALYCLSIQICSGDVPLPAPAAASASSTTVQSNFMTGAPTTFLSGCRELHTALPLTTTTSTAVLRPPGKPPDSWGVLEVADSQKYDDCLATEIFIGDLFVVRSPWPPPLWNSSPGVDSKLQSLTLQLITSKTKPIEVQFQLCYLCNADMNYNASSCARFECLALPWDPGDETTKWNGRPDELLWYKAIHNGIRSACQFLDRPDPLLPWDPGDHTECFHVRARLSAIHTLFSLDEAPWVSHSIISLDVQSEHCAPQRLCCRPNGSLLHEAPCLLLEPHGHNASLLCRTRCWPVIFSVVLVYYTRTTATCTDLLSSWKVIIFHQAPWDPGGVRLEQHPKVPVQNLYLAMDNVIPLVCYSSAETKFMFACWWKHLVGALQWLPQMKIQKITVTSLMSVWPVTMNTNNQVMIRLTKTFGVLHHPIYPNSTVNLSILMTRSVQPMVKKADDVGITCFEVPQRLLLHFLLLANKMLWRTPQLMILKSHGGEAVDDPWGQGSQKEGVMSCTRPSWSNISQYLVGPACKGVREREGYISQYLVPTESVNG